MKNLSFCYFYPIGKLFYNNLSFVLTFSTNALYSSPKVQNRKYTEIKDE